MSDEPINTTHNIRTCPCAVCRQLQGRHEAFVRGLKRGLELAEEHVKTTGYEDEDSLDWSAAYEAVAKECK